MIITDTHVYFVTGIYSNWFCASFKMPLVPGTRALEFINSEQAFMAYKALHFADYTMIDRILMTPDPKEQKLLGRQVKNFDREEWMRVARDYMFDVNVSKFTQNPELGKQLLSTGDRIMVEAAWYDEVWGVGLRETDPLIYDSKNWKGLNWLGETLMEVRECLTQGELELEGMTSS